MNVSELLPIIIDLALRSKTQRRGLAVDLYVCWRSVHFILLEDTGLLDPPLPPPASLKREDEPRW